jgi:hypothetical protein
MSLFTASNFPLTHCRFHAIILQEESYGYCFC